MFFDVKYRWKVRTIQEDCFASFRKIKKHVLSAFNSCGVVIDNINDEFNRITFYFAIISYYFSATYINLDCRNYFISDSLENFYAHYEKDNMQKRTFYNESESIINNFILVFCLPNGYSIKDMDFFNGLIVIKKGKNHRNFTNLYLFYIKMILIIIDGFTLDGFAFEMFNDVEISFVNKSNQNILIQKIYDELLLLNNDLKITKEKIKMIKKYKHKYNEENEFEKIELFEEKE